MKETSAKDKKIIFSQSEELVELKQNSKTLTSTKAEKQSEITALKEQNTQMQKKVGILKLYLYMCG